MASLASTGLRSLLSGFTQDTRLLQLHTPLGPDVLLAEAARGEEGVDQGFRFEIDALSLDAHIPLKRLVAQPALLQLLTASSRDLRPFHGYITAARLTGSNGGLARYRLRLEPWTAFLGIGRDSRIFQNMSVREIATAIFASWQGKGRLDPDWRFDLLDPGVYSKRSLATQYQESDLAFVLRLFNEEGLFCWVEHQGAPCNAGLGGHTLVIGDHNHAFASPLHAPIEFSRAGVMVHDTLDSWSIRHREQAGAVELLSWDYRSLFARPVSATDGSNRLTVREALGQYAWTTREQGERMARDELLALNARRELHGGAGTVRTLGAGTTFRVHGNDHLDDAGDEAARTFLALRVTHQMHNNLSAEIRDAIHARLDPAVSDEPMQLYRMRVDAMRSDLPYRAGRLDEHGRLRYPKPNVGGQQTAIVVGPSDSVVHTDRDHRIKIQFHWQHGQQSHSRLRHPMPDGHIGAPADDSAGTWVRIATPLGAIAGANWGSNAIPRIGQEVLVDFMDGDIDRPVVIGSLYNGRGQTDAQHNQARYGTGAATGNAPAWFAGEAGAHAHPAVLSGLKSQALSASADGGGGYGQLVFDATAGQTRVSLQRHASAHQGTDELNLGFLRHQVDNQRLQPVGFGAEMKTAHSLAVRAGQGVLLSAGGKAGSGPMMESPEAQAQIAAAARLQEQLAGLARQHNATTGQQGKASNEVAKPDKAASESLFVDPALVLYAKAGIVATTPGSAVIASGAMSRITAGHDINLCASGSMSHAVEGGISLFTSGKLIGERALIKDTGVMLHAASGNVSLQSQSDRVTFTADKTITVASVTKNVHIAAKLHLLLTAQGAAIKLEGGNITLQCSGSIEFKAGTKELTGPRSAEQETVTMPKPKPLADCPARLESAASGGAAVI